MRINGIIIGPRMSSIFDLITKIRNIGKSFIGIGVIGSLTIYFIFKFTLIGIILIISFLLMIIIGLTALYKPTIKSLSLCLIYLVIGTIISILFFAVTKSYDSFTGFVFIMPLLYICKMAYNKGIQLKIVDSNYELYFAILDKFKRIEFKNDIIKFISYTPIQTKKILCLPYKNGLIITTRNRDMLKTINKSQFKIIKHNNGKNLVKGKYQINDTIEKFEMKRKEFDKLNDYFI